MLSRKRSSPLLAILILTVTVGCATPAGVKVASKAQIDGFRDVKTQLSALHRQIEDLLLSYADLTVEGFQRQSMLSKIDDLSSEGVPLSEADRVVKETWEQAARDLEDEMEILAANLNVLAASRDAALKEIDNLIAMHSIINDYLQIDLTVSKDDVQEITAAIKELRDGGARR